MNINETALNFEKDKIHSIELSKTSTGKYSYSVKLYFKEVEEADNILNKVAEIEEKLKEKYSITKKEVQ